MYTHAYLCACTHIHWGGDKKWVVTKIFTVSQDILADSSWSGLLYLSSLYICPLGLNSRIHEAVDIFEWILRNTHAEEPSHLQRYFRTGTQIISPAEHQPLGLEASRKAERALIKAKENKQVKKKMCSANT